MTTPNSTDAPNLSPDATSRPSGRWLQIALALSLAVNLGIAGVVAGAMFRHGGPTQTSMMARDPGFGPFTEALSKEDRAQLRRAFWAAVPQMRDSRNAMHADADALLGQLRATPLDADGLRKVMDRQTARTAERLNLGQRLILDLIVGMTDEARLAFADRLEQSLNKRPKRRNEPAQP